MACQINNASITKGARFIAYDNVTQGHWTIVEDGMIMLIGSSPGSGDKGRLRIKTADIIAFHVAENSDVDWADDLYITVLKYVEITAIYPRIIQDPADDENVIFYKDYNIAYTNQNSSLGSFICMGSNFAGFLEGGQADVFYSASGTSHVKGDGLTYEWFFDGGSVTGSTSHTPGYITYTSPGHYMTRLRVRSTVTGSAFDTSYRFISIYDRPENGTNNPILQWELLDFSGSRVNGGYSLRIKIHELISRNILRDGALVVIFAEDWYGDTKQSIGGNAIERQTIAFSGYVLDDTITYDYEASSVEFEVVSPTGVMQDSEGFSCSVESKVNPSTWFELLDMDVRRSLYHYLRWHSTVMKCCDFEFIGQDQKIQYFDADRTSLYDAIQTLMKGTLIGDVVSDRQGKLFAEVDVSATNNAATSFNNSMVMDKQNWFGEPIIEERTTRDISFIEAGGIAYSSPYTGTFSAHMAGAPGDAPSYRGHVERFQGLALETQAQLNELVGNVFAFKNSRYPNISLQLAGNYRNLDIAPQELTPLYITPDDTVRNLTFGGKAFAVRGMSWMYNGEQSLLLPMLNISEVTQGLPGDTIPIPDEAPTGGYDQPPFDDPPPPWTGDCPPGIWLFDEGVLLGRVISLDFRGGMEASILGEDGTVTYYCGEDIVAPIALSGEGMSAPSWPPGGGKDVTYATAYTHALNDYIDPGDLPVPYEKIIILRTAGTFRANAYATVQFTNWVAEFQAGGTYWCILNIEHYNSLDVLQNTYTDVGTHCYLYKETAVGAFNRAVTFSFAGLDETFEGDVGDYLKMTVNLSVGFTAGMLGVSKFQVWRIPNP
jgi:hypothetical protein